MEYVNHSDIWQASVQLCWQGTTKIPKQYNYMNYQSRSYVTAQNLTISVLMDIEITPDVTLIKYEESSALGYNVFALPICIGVPVHRFMSFYRKNKHSNGINHHVVS